MSQVFHGVVMHCPEAKARTLFASIDSKVPLRLVRLDDDVFGIYAGRRHDSRILERIPGELQRIAAEVSKANGVALYYMYDSRVGDWNQLFEDGTLTREIDPFKDERKSWGMGDPLEAIGARRVLHKVVEEAFLYDILDPLAEYTPGVRTFPGFEVVSHCPQDGMPIYRCWIESGIATEVACPDCLSREADVSKENAG